MEISFQWSLKYMNRCSVSDLATGWRTYSILFVQPYTQKR